MFKFDTNSIESYVQLPPFLLKRRSTYIALIADGGNHFLQDGIIEGTTIFVDLEAEYENDKLCCFVSEQREFKLHRSKPAGYEYAGRVVVTCNKIEV